ncbi:hypothetical protein FQN53_007857 [Emmonsiellopsis sp. PD_33]|nr:hypothetical protein FQN53_007857 [Emmonsiellopsis sp. PD_33]
MAIPNREERTEQTIDVAREALGDAGQRRRGIAGNRNTYFLKQQPSATVKTGENKGRTERDSVNVRSGSVRENSRLDSVRGDETSERKRDRLTLGSEAAAQEPRDESVQTKQRTGRSTTAEGQQRRDAGRRIEEAVGGGWVGETRPGSAGRLEKKMRCS